jgi:ABC-type amino acid transport system permease subunit
MKRHRHPGKKPATSFNLRLALFGAAAGGLVGIIAFLLGASPWWWLAVAVGVALGFVSSKSLTVPVLWVRK